MFYDLKLAAFDRFAALNFVTSFSLLPSIFYTKNAFLKSNFDVLSPLSVITVIGVKC